MGAREFERDSLKRVEPAAEVGARSLKLAKGWLKRAKDSNILGYRDLAVIASFTSMLYAARAILLRDGVKEKDDCGMIEYLRKRYPQLKGHAASLEQYGRLALAIQRDPDMSVGRSDAKAAMNTADELIKSAEKMLSK